MLGRINRTVARELTHYPRGERKSAQNVFRAVYQMLRASSLGQKEPWSGSAKDCAMQAIAIARETHPEFVPIVRV